MRLMLLAVAAFCGLCGNAEAAVNAVTPGAFHIERPTLLSLGFDWSIKGDDNRNASVAVTYRKVGENTWRKALPLFRLGGEFIAGPKPQYGGLNYYDYKVPPGFAGSVLNLEPNTEYEVHFVMRDPDGVRGKAEKMAKVRTRKVPAPASGGRVFQVWPFSHKGPLGPNEFTGLLAAYYMGADESDHSNVFAPRVRPGDVILVHAGVYKDNRFAYGGFDRSIENYGTSFDGTYYLTASGTPEKPIVIKAAGDGEVVFDGDGNDTLFNLLAANYNYFDGISLRNTNVGFLLGIKDITGADGFTLTNSRADNIGRVVRDDWAKSKDYYIANNVFIGRHNPNRLTSWITPNVWAKFGEFPAPITSEYAVKVYGQGHVVAHNYVANFHDAIDNATFGNPSAKPEDQGSSVDFYGNDMFNITDNCIELDGGVHNMRAFENRCFNTAQPAYSTQPIFGGPAYIYRNISYNTVASGGLKLLDNPSGILIYNNTFVGAAGALGPLSNFHFRNNLIVGDGAARAIFPARSFTDYSSSDYNGFGPNAPRGSFSWDVIAVEGGNGGPARKTYDTLADYQKGSGQDAHSIQVGLDTFLKVTPTNAADPPHLYNPEDYDFSLKPDSAAIDRGVELPNITDGFNGRAPDLGALELGKPLPHYGPEQWPLGVPSSGPRSITGPPH
ncbi:MAG: hypothetical protein JO256_05495 [Alphaproteobacteria bacterium]|nr:hypothetical protein [Alphaproteobacteria bacterium]